MEFNQFKVFKKFKKIINKFNDIHLVIRVHPSLSDKKSYDDDDWMKYSNKNTTVIQSYEKFDTYSLLFKSDIVVTYTSSIIVESAYFGLPSVSLGEFWWTGLKIVEEPRSINKLKKMLSKGYVFKKRDKKGCLKIANYFLNFGIKFKYYFPISETRGKFLGEYLTWKPKFLTILEKNKFFNIVKNLILSRI
jgi:capsule polysaccharide export protein KpsC/LpsZ